MSGEERRCVPTGTRVLIVEDDRDIGDALADLLSLHGLIASHVADGNAALAWLASTSRLPDVVLMDWNMPGLDGAGFLSRVPATLAHRLIFVVMSAAPPPPDALPRHVTAVLAKPFTWQQLVAAVEPHLALADA